MGVVVIGQIGRDLVLRAPLRIVGPRPELIALAG
jgi:hypothetical protein